MSIASRHHINVLGSGERTLVFAHGFGCDQNMWRLLIPAFENDYRIVLFDYVGFGKSDSGQYDRERYSTLDGYADDVLRIIDEVGGAPVTFIGHSVSAVIGVLASLKEPEKFEGLVLIGPSASYINDGEYVGGFSREDIEGLLETLDNNYLGWSSAMAPVIMGNSDRPDLSEELTESFCRSNPEIAKQFARATFLSDNRADLPRVKTPTLILQCSEDVIAPQPAGEFVHRQISGSSFVQLQATGHCPHLSAPEETITAIQSFLDQRP